ncbi:MAG: hypothetical protein U1F43_29075 [Myxococcota bacterium]
MNTPSLSSAVGWLSLGFALAGGAACSDAGAPPDTGTTPDADASEPGDGDEPVEPQGPALVERAPLDTTTCSETLAPMTPALKDWVPLAAVALDDAVWALQAIFDAQSGAQSLAIGRVERDGSLGARTALPSANVWSDVALAALGQDLFALWHDLVGRLTYAVVDATEGTITTQGEVGASGLGALVVRDEAVFVVVGGGAGLEVRRSSGAEPAEPVTLDAAPGNVTALSAVATPAGLAVAWSATGADPDASDLWLQRADATGAPVGGRLRVSPAPRAGHSYADAFYGGSPKGAATLLAVGDDLWATYTDGWVDFNGVEGPAGYTGAIELYLAVVHADDRIDRYPLDTPTVGRASGPASLFHVGSAVGASWAAGSTIFVCAGCFVDNDIHLLLLDPASLTPLAAPFVHAHRDHGVYRLRPVLVGDDVWTLATQDFHGTPGWPALAIASRGAR